MNNIRIRGANKHDAPLVDALFKSQGFVFDIKHLERLVITENNLQEVISILSLNTILEATFFTVEGSSKRDRVASLIELVEFGKKEVVRVGYDRVHAFANDLIKDILIKKFNFTATKGTNLVLLME